MSYLFPLHEDEIHGDLVLRLPRCAVTIQGLFLRNILDGEIIYFVV